MATKSKFRELNLGPSEPITRRNSVAGMQVVSDYLDAITNQRTLLLKRIESPLISTGPLKAKSSRKRKAAGKTNSGVIGEATAFPGSAAANG